ncbi:MAG TPA: MFS transporter [Reyranella sp.]|nr:MFS transporter [Reyranella sp.]
MSAPGAAALAFRLLQRIVAVRPEEVRAVGWCWLYIFAVLSSYYILRPIRDQMGVAGGVNNLPWLFTGTLAGMVLLNLPFAYLVKKLPRSRFIPLTYRFFALNIVLFAIALRVVSPEQEIWVGRIFFIWASVYNLFVVSVFWQLNVDLFSPEQGKRLFGFIAAGATIGAIVGSAVTASLARYVSPTMLMVGAALLLEVAVFSVGRLAKLSPVLHHRPGDQAAASADEKPVGGSVLAGITHAFRSPYLLAVSAFLLLYAVTSTFVYFQQAAIVSHSFTDRGAQTSFFASIDLGVNSLALLFQLFFTGRLIVLLGVALALALLPALTMLGFAALALTPSLGVIAAFQIIRRAADYAIARPTREVIYTVVSREDRYKTKGFIDTFVYRLGDQVGAWAMAPLNGVGARAASLVAIAVAALWLLNALWLGRRQQSLEAEERRRVMAEAPAE